MYLMATAVGFRLLGILRNGFDDRSGLNVPVQQG